MKHLVIRDVQEKVGFWNFNPSDWCTGTEVRKLDTGDYTFDGYEELFTIERKKNTSEISLNINEARFVKELERLDGFQYPFIVCEFSYQDIIDFPNNSGIPRYLWENLKVSSHLILKKIIEFQARYKAKWILAGKDNGQRVCSCIMKRMAEIISNEKGKITTRSKSGRNKK